MQLHNPYRHSYGRWWLKRQRLKLFRGTKEIYGDVPPIPENYALERWNKSINIQPVLHVGNFERDDNIKILTRNHSAILEEMGYKIKTVRRNRRMVYSIVSKYSTSGRLLNYIPPTNYVEYNTVKKTLMLRGKGSDNGVVYMDGLKDSKPLYEVLPPDKKIQVLLGLAEVTAPDAEPLEIQELVVGISEDQKLVTIPIGRDPPRFGFVGMTGKGKTMALHAIATQLRHHLDIPWIHLDDEKGETFEWSDAWDNLETKSGNAEFYKRIVDWIGVDPIGSPCIYFSPNIEDYSIKKERGLKLNDESMHYFISLDWEDIMKNYNLYFSKFEEMKPGKSKRYMDWEELKKCKTREEVFSKIREIGGLRTESKHDIIAKLESIFKSLFSHKLTNLDSGIPSKLKVEKYDLAGKPIWSIELNPFIAAVYCGLCPVLQVRELKSVQFGNDSVFPAYVKSLVRQIIDFKRNDELLKDKMIYIIIDELPLVSRQGGNEPIIDLATMGRSDKIGLMWAGQDYVTPEIPKSIKSNTHYLFVSCSGSDEDVRAMAKDFCGSKKKTAIDLLQSVGQEGERFEVVLLHKEPVILYDVHNGERKIEYREPIKLTMIPPLGKHT